MKNKIRILVAAAPLAALAFAAPAEARRDSNHRSHRVSKKNDHGNCLRFNKTTGAVAGAVAGGLLGRAVDGGGATGTLLGAGAGGLAGHSLARNGRKRC